ncbi:MAG: sigma-54-dependent Fis family transcriptional regulator [Holophagales bacterium]|nr:sigma-54-dependent Fis family transcriptional regulator [Holophagales bacterium]
MTEPVGRLLIVEDERAQRDALVQYLSRRGHHVVGVSTGEEALERLAVESFGLLVTDLRLPGVDGLTVVRRARELDEEMGVLLTTAFASVESAIEALRLGAHDYLLKPLILEEVARKVANLLAHGELVRENGRLRRMLNERDSETEIVSVSAAMQEVLGWVRRAAGSRATVLVSGETGTGKEVVSRSIHQLGAGRDEPFLAVNLAALPDTLVESELFGHERGAFTGAERRREGILRAAGRGTVFLDEIGELSLAAQAKLLRALEAREVQPLGSDRTAPFEARLIVATHRRLADLVETHAFREDLYYRLAVLEIHVPPLRERREDVPGLVQRLLQRNAQRSGIPVPIVTASAMRALCQYLWRGNVRELANVLDRALILADDGRIDVEQIPSDVRSAGGPDLDLTQAIDRFERGYIAMALRLSGGNREKAAEDLGISPATLYRRLERFGLKGGETGRNRS